MKLTIVISKVEEFYIGTIKEIPAVISQGETIEEAKENVKEALAFYFEDMQQDGNYENKVLEEDLTIG